MAVYENNHLERVSTNRPRRHCFVVANRSGARIFVKSGHEPPMLVHAIDHPQGRAHERELRTDKPGRTFASWSGQSVRHALGKKVLPHEEDLIDFTAELAQHLAKDRAEANYDDLTIVAEPHFSGVLLEHLDTDLRRAISHSVHKDLAYMNDIEVVDYLQHNLS